MPSFLFYVLFCKCTNPEKNMPSDVGGVGLQPHHYSDEKLILLIPICFLPVLPRLFLLLKWTSSWLPLTAPKGQAASTLTFSCSSHSFHFTWLCLPSSFFYAHDIPSLLCPYLVFSHLPCGLLKDISAVGLNGADRYIFDECFGYDTQAELNWLHKCLKRRCRVNTLPVDN